MGPLFARGQRKLIVVQWGQGFVDDGAGYAFLVKFLAQGSRTAGAELDAVLDPPTGERLIIQIRHLAQSGENASANRRAVIGLAQGLVDLMFGSRSAGEEPKGFIHASLIGVLFLQAGDSLVIQLLTDEEARGQRIGQGEGVGVVKINVDPSLVALLLDQTGHRAGHGGK